MHITSQILIPTSIKNTSFMNLLCTKRVILTATNNERPTALLHHKRKYTRKMIASEICKMYE